MHAYRSRSTILAAFLGVAATAVPAAARAQADIPIKATITLAGRTETTRATGSCGHEPRAWLNGSAAALWLVEYEGAQRVALRYWRPAAPGAAPQFFLSVERGAAAHRIATMAGGKPEGSGRSTFRPTALGAVFEITGKDQSGATLQVIIECARFGGIHAEGG